MTALVFFTTSSMSDDPAAWQRALGERVPDLDFRVWPEIGDPAEVDVALVWRPQPGLLKSLPNLKLIASLGMGVDHIFADPELPAHVPVARIVDEDMVRQMSEYVLTYLLYRHRLGAVYRAQQTEKLWRGHPFPITGQTRVGILGMGTIGGDTARKLAMLGFDVAGWSRSKKSLDGINSFAGAEQLTPFLNRSDYLVCLLPLTPETENILDAAAFTALPEGAYVINCARGLHIVEEDLLAALDSEHLSGATLDVTRSEPLPQDSPLWQHPKITITPHIAGITNPLTAADQVAENILRAREGRALLNLVDPDKGY